jgi:hypothetical protein
MESGSPIPTTILEPIAENLKILDRAFVKYNRPEDCSRRGENRNTAEAIYR